jgi:hypothetical protein
VSRPTRETEIAPAPVRSAVFLANIHALATTGRISQRRGPASISDPEPINGVDPRTGKKWGPSTGDPRTFTSFEQFYKAFKDQVAYVMDTSCRVNNHAAVLRGEYYRLPLWSTFMNDCIKKGLDWTQGGQRWHGAELTPKGGQDRRARRVRSSFSTPEE